MRAELYRPYLGGGAVAIVTNAVVAPLYLPKARRPACRARASRRSSFADGEQAKSWQTLNRVFDALLAARSAGTR